MNKIDFKKFGILLAMMLVAGAALVGPVSAVNPAYTTSMKLTAGGSSSSYFSVAQTISGSSANYITTTAVLYDDYDNYLDHVTASGSGVSSVIATESNSNGDRSYVQASFESVSPTESYYYATYYL